MAKIAAKASGDLRNQIVDAALSLAVKKGWGQTSLGDIACEIGCSLSELYAVFDSREDILAAYGRRVDAQVIEAMQGQSLEGDSPKDRLFDILMERFDVLNQDREAICSILCDLYKDPKQVLFVAPFLCRSMTWMMETAGYPTHGWGGTAKIAGLTAVYLRVLREWVRDDSLDMAKTMSVLDQSLDQAGRVAGWLRL